MHPVKFRKFDYSQDSKRLFEFMMKEKNQRLFSHTFQIQTQPMFEQWLSEKLARGEYHDFFMIENAKSETIGFTFSYEFLICDAHCKYTLCLYDEYQNSGYGALAGIQMMDYLFCKYPLRRIFVSIFEYNQHSLAVHKKGGFTEVATLPEYRFWGGNYYSLHILTISRAEFYATHGKILERISKHKEED